MCRFVVYLGPPITLGSLVTEPSHSLIHQSYRSLEREEPLNGDGFGVAWYAPRRPFPAVFRSISPAWSNRNLLHLAPVTQSECVLAHVRAATPGMPVAESNCHPFVHEQFAFMHNGAVAGFGRIKRALLRELSDASFGAIEGSTDSEHVFALLLDQIRGGGDPDRDRFLLPAVQETIRRVVALAQGVCRGQATRLNLAVTDGRQAVVSRYTSDPAGKAESLYVHTGRRYTCADGVCRMIEAQGGHGAVVISSEPLTEGPGWEAVPVNHCVEVGPDRTVRIQPV